MKKNLWEHKIPTWGAVFGLILALWVTTYLVRSTIFVVTRASVDTVPQNITIANITDTSFSVAFTTPAKTTAAISIGDGVHQTIVPDIRDSSSSKQNEYFSHLITVTHLKASTPYQFAVIANASVYLNANKKYTVTTAPTLESSPLSSHITGSTTFPDGNPATDTLVIFTSPNAQTLAGVTDSKGAYTFNTTIWRSKDLSSFFEQSTDTQGALSFTYQALASSIQFFLNMAQPLPIITLGNTYDFTQINSDNLISSASGSLVLPSPHKTSRTVQISFPKSRASLADTRPLFQGTALPNQKITITIHSDPIATVIASDQNGLWSYRPQTPLAVGDHTITIATINASGIMQQITQSFTVFASGVQVAQTATPSATPTFTPTPSPTILSSATPTPTINSALTPTVTLAPTPTTAPLPTISPVPTVAVFTTPQPTIPPTGTNTSVILTSISILFILTGTTLLFLL